MPFAIGLIGLLFGPLSSAAGLRGEYGYLTAFHCQSEAEARARVRTMAREFGIREFQLYDWFSDYSTPTRGERWTDPFFHRREVCRATLTTYTDEIHRQGGRAWAYVQAVGAEELSSVDPARAVFPLFNGSGRWHWHAQRFPCYFLNAAWARQMVARWAPSVRQLGFDGIHWDTLGPLGRDRALETTGTHAFLRTAQAELRRYGLGQTLNFIDMAWWDLGVVLATVEFPYAEVWTQGTMRNYYQAMMRPELLKRRGAIAFYPTIDKPADWTEFQVLLARRREAAQHGLAYIAIGDGDRRIVREYWPTTAALLPEERRALAVGGSPAERRRATAVELLRQQGGAKPAYPALRR